MPIIIIIASERVDPLQARSRISLQFLSRRFLSPLGTYRIHFARAFRSTHVLDVKRELSICPHPTPRPPLDCALLPMRAPSLFLRAPDDLRAMMAEDEHR